ncbi:MAG TPA: DMT family transporter [Dehalococcoidia bacterium]|nr:DMT family transporter [Dehalococcoidia bacterium]
MSRQVGLLILGIAAISSAAVLVRLADAPFLVIAAFRLMIASALLAPAGMVCSRDQMTALLKSTPLLVIAAGACLALHFALWIASLSYTTVASSVVLVTANPLFVALASRVLFGERLKRWTFVGIGVSIVGAALIARSACGSGASALVGDALALAAALAMAVYLLIGRRLRPTVGLLPYSTLVFGIAALLLGTGVLGFGLPVTGYSGTTYLAMVLLALVPQLVGHMTLNWALRFLPATMVTIAILGEPVGATALAAVVLGELPQTLEVVGGVLILGGIAVAYLRGGLSSWADVAT